jgi:hemoglobin-like flavoprotein
MHLSRHPLARSLPGDDLDARVDVQLIHRLRASMAKLLASGDVLPSTFYALLFERYPPLRSLFPADMSQQKVKLTSTLAWVVTHLDRPEQLLPAVCELGRRHAGYGVLPEHYPLVRDALVEAMALTGGAEWEEALMQDWRQSIDLLGRHMLSGHQATGAANSGPPA